MINATRKYIYSNYKQVVKHVNNIYEYYFEPTDAEYLATEDSIFIITEKHKYRFKVK